MNDPVQSVLEVDHHSLSQLLIKLHAELAKPNFPNAFDLLDLFWARLAVHIRAEHLHLFPALTNAPQSKLTGHGGLPTPEEVHNVLVQLHSDHDFFMKELSQMMKAAREIRSGREAGIDEASEMNQRLIALEKRLEAHNQVEERQAYTWPALVFDEATISALRERLAHELENLPARFTSAETINDNGQD